ncbi:hypothetical protein H4219_002230 [Mycoemilia scoparia]|uniref:Uncharacterized protein n=1 Tax=Mycoemilia scoparia TaxID=417184 RepID=A0A9W7ZY61_9FUNG|nr:hypothetical protein H4219_002230 [Mycoemilia scoparia]
MTDANSHSSPSSTSSKTSMLKPWRSSFIKRASSKFVSSRISAAFGRSTPTHTPPAAPVSNTSAYTDAQKRTAIQAASSSPSAFRGGDQDQAPRTSDSKTTHIGTTSMSHMPIAREPSLPSSRTSMAAGRFGHKSRPSTDENVSWAPLQSLDSRLSTIDETLSGTKTKGKNKRNAIIQNRTPLVELDSNALDGGYRISLDQHFQIPTVAQTASPAMMLNQSDTFVDGGNNPFNTAVGNDAPPVATAASPAARSRLLRRPPINSVAWGSSGTTSTLIGPRPPRERAMSVVGSVSGIMNGTRKSENLSMVISGPVRRNTLRDRNLSSSTSTTQKSSSTSKTTATTSTASISSASSPHRRNSVLARHRASSPYARSKRISMSLRSPTFNPVTMPQTSEGGHNHPSAPENVFENKPNNNMSPSRPPRNRTNGVYGNCAGMMDVDDLGGQSDMDEDEDALSLSEFASQLPISQEMMAGNGTHSQASRNRISLMAVSPTFENH